MINRTTNNVAQIQALVSAYWVDAALVTCALALLCIGIAASAGSFNAIGTTNAAYVSYGLYGGTTLLALIEVVKRAKNCATSIPSQPLKTDGQLETSGQPTANTHKLDQGILDSIEELKGYLPAGRLKNVELFLSKGYETYLEHYGFYYELSCLTEDAMKGNQIIKDKWKAFLNTINGHQVARIGIYENRVVCTIELQRMEGRNSDLKIEELEIDSPTYEKDLTTLSQIFVEAFTEEGPPNPKICSKILQGQFADKNNRPFVIRRASDQAILGLICLNTSESKKEPGKKDLYVHTLARAPSAVKLGITEKFKEHFKNILKKEEYSRVWCDVLADNKPAQYIYEKLGFKEDKSAKPNSFKITMELDLNAII